MSSCVPRSPTVTGVWPLNCRSCAACLGDRCGSSRYRPALIRERQVTQVGRLLYPGARYAILTDQLSRFVVDEERSLRKLINTSQPTASYERPLSASPDGPTFIIVDTFEALLWRRQQILSFSTGAIVWQYGFLQVSPSPLDSRWVSPLKYRLRTLRYW